MKIRLIPTVVLASTLLTIVGRPTPCSAQDPNRDQIVAPADVGTVVDRVQKQAGQFKGEFNDAVSHSTIDGTRLEDNAKHRANELHDSASKLGDVFHDKKDKNNPAVRTQVDRTLAAASELNRVMLAHRFTDKLQQDWGVLRAELNALAAMYQLTLLDGK